MSVWSSVQQWYEVTPNQIFVAVNKPFNNLRAKTTRCPPCSCKTRKWCIQIPWLHDWWCTTSIAPQWFPWLPEGTLLHALWFSWERAMVWKGGGSIRPQANPGHWLQVLSTDLESWWLRPCQPKWRSPCGGERHPDETHLFSHSRCPTLILAEDCPCSLLYLFSLSENLSYSICSQWTRVGMRWRGKGLRVWQRAGVRLAHILDYNTVL